MMLEGLRDKANANTVAPEDSTYTVGSNLADPKQSLMSRIAFNY